MEWIINNKEWLFSGAGIAAVMAIIAITRIIIVRRRQPKDQHQSANTLRVPEQTQLPSPPAVQKSCLIDQSLQVIFADINSRPPFQQEDTKKHYIGTLIRFEGVLFSLNKRDDNEVHVTLSQGQDAMYPSVKFVVNVTDNPKFKFIHEDTPITVVGKIIELGHSDATLEDVEFE
jgi:hypothetical protein